MFHAKVDPETTYIISDTHRNHKNICGATTTWSSGFRDFDSLEMMNCAIDDSMKVPNGKTLFHLGDTIFGDKTFLPEWISHLRTIFERIYLIYGNHDDFIRKNQDYINLFDGCFDYLEISLGKRLICMSHFPLYSWRDIKRGSYHLHGHEHGGLTDYYDSRRAIDVGWDVWRKPISLSYIDSLLCDKPILRVGHH